MPSSSPARPRRAFLTIALTTLAFTCAPLMAQVTSAPAGDCLGSWEGPGIPGVDQPPQFVFEWNHDGDTSTPPWLIVGATGMTTAGATNVRTWAAWDGTNWHSLLGGIPQGVLDSYDPSYFPLTSDASTGALWYFQPNSLYYRDPASGLWTNYPSSATASTWSTSHSPTPYASDFVIHGGVPHFIGRVGLEGTRGLFSWNGSGWTFVATFPITSGAPEIYHLYSVNGELYLTDASPSSLPSRPSIWQLVADAWQPVGDGWAAGGAVRYLAAFQGSLIASSANIPDSSCNARRYARWTGSQWEVISDICAQTPIFAVRPDGLYFLKRPALQQPSLARWNGTQVESIPSPSGWQGQHLASFRDGLVGWSPTRLEPLMNPVLAIEFSGAGLTFWNANQFSVFGSGFNEKINVLKEHNGSLYAGGRFVRFGNTITGCVARRNGTTWESVSQQPLRDEVLDITSWQGHLVTGSLTATRKLVDETWLTIGGPGRKLIEYHGDLYRATGYTLERFDGAIWSTVLTVGPTVNAPNASYITSLRIIDDDLYIVGPFSLVNGLPTEGVATWNGLNVSVFSVPRPLSSFSFPLEMKDIAKFRGLLYATMGGGVYRLDSGQWTLINWNRYSDSGAGALLPTENFLFASAWPSLDSDYGRSSQVAAFDGTAWHPVVGSTAARDLQHVLALASFDNKLHIAGNFTTLFDRDSRTLDTLDFAYWAAWTPPAACDSIDFNNDTSFYDPQDVEAFLSVYSEGPCVPEPAACNDIDFNNDCSLFDPCDINSFLVLYSEGPCTPCGN